MSRRHRYKDIQLPQLRSFCVAATQGNFTAAAKVLGLSAPTVWEQVRGLERRLGASLLLRRGRLVELTPEGRLLLQLVQPHVNGLDSLERLFESQRTTQPQRLTIASSPNLLANHVAEVLGRFADEYPAVCMDLRPSTHMDESLRLIERGHADLGILTFRPEEPHDSALEFERLFDLRLLLLAAVQHPLARKKSVAMADVVQYPLIAPQEGTASRQMVEKLLRRHGLMEHARFIMESSHFDVVCSCIAAGLGIALMFGGTEGKWSTRGLHRRVFDPQLEGLPVGLVLRKGAHRSDAVEAFRSVVRRALQRAEQD